MTACAMTVGMVPMALGLERGSQMEIPLGRAVIGGLVMSTVATLLVLPPIFAIVVGRRKAHSPSVYPGDPESKHYDSDALSDEQESGKESSGRDELGKSASHNEARWQASQLAPPASSADDQSHRADGGDALGSAPGGPAKPPPFSGDA